MKSSDHFVIGGVSAVLPDIALALFGWRKTWLGDEHPLVKVHRFLHGPRGLIFIILIGWSSHIIIDWLSPHRTGPTK